MNNEFENSSFIDYILIIIALVSIAFIYFLYRKKSYSDQRKNINLPDVEISKEKIITDEEIKPILIDWFRILGFQNPEKINLNDVYRTAKKKILKDVEDILRDDNMSLIQKKESLLSLLGKDYSLKNLDKVSIPDNLKKFDKVNIRSLNFFFKKYVKDFENISPNNLEEKLKELISNMYNVGINEIKNTALFTNIKFLENAFSEEEISKGISHIKEELNYQFKRF